MKLYFRCLKNDRYRQGYSHNNSINLGTNSFFVVPRPIFFVMGISNIPAYYFVAENLKFDKQLTKCPYHTDLSLFAFVFSCVSYRD